MSFLNINLCDSMANKIAREIQEEVDRQIFNDIYDVEWEVGARRAQEVSGMDPVVYYLYVLTLKYGWRITKYSTDGTNTTVDIRSDTLLRTKTFVLQPREEQIGDIGV